MGPYPLPIETFIVKRMDQLGLRPAQVAERCGIRNIRTGLRALGNVYRGIWENEGARAILRNLAAALEVEESLVAAEVHRTKEAIANAKRKAEAEQEARMASCLRGPRLPDDGKNAARAEPCAPSPAGRTGG